MTIFIGWYAQLKASIDTQHVGKKVKKYASPSLIFLSTDVSGHTFGRATNEEAKKLKDMSRMVFIKRCKDTILFSENHYCVESKDAVVELQPQPEPNDEWKQLVIKLFNPETIEFKYGVVIACEVTTYGGR